MSYQIEQLVTKYRAVSQFPSLTAARIIADDGPHLTVVSAWSQRCLEKGKISKYSQTHLVRGTDVIHTPPIDSSTELLWAFSPSGLSRAVLRELTPLDGGSKKQHLEIWKDNCLSQLVDLTLLDQHGEVYTNGEFSCLEWSEDEKKLVYVAEKKQPKAEPFYPSKLKGKEKDKDVTTPGDDQPKKGEEYIYRQDWGETMVGRHHPVLCVCDLPSGTVSVPTGVPDELSVGQALFVKDGIVAVGWSHRPRRLGIVYCTNRLSYVFHLSNDGVFTKLSGEDMAAHSPRLSILADFLVWLQRPAEGPHHACHQLVKYVWGGKPETLVDYVAFEKKIANHSQDFYGLYCQTLPARCFHDNLVLLSTPQATTVNSYLVNTDNGDITPIQQEEGSLAVLDVVGMNALFSLSRVDTPPSLYMANLAPDKRTLIPLLQRPSIPPATKDLNLHIFNLEAEVKDRVSKFNAIYYGPTEGEPFSVPLIVWPHGGPHSSFVQSYSVYNQFFINTGFATLQVNYRGSTGQGQESVSFLPGRVGDTDVKDCYQATKHALEQFTVLDPKRVVLYGGSHGGFLVLHLSGQYPETFQAVVAVNPVVDISSMAFCTDIPDWAVVEGGEKYVGSEQTILTPDLLSKLWKMSPIQYANKVKAYTLLNIGKKDLRVPPSQGTQYYHALNYYNAHCKMNLYDDNHSLSTVPVEMDATINAVLWFLEHMKDH